MSDKRPRSLAQFIDRLQARGRYVFLRQEALDALGASEIALKLAAQRLVAKRRLAMPRRGFFVIVPLEHSTSGAPPASWFVDELMKFHRAPYYVGLLSAAALHGAAHQQPQELQILTNLQLRPTAAGRVRLRFFKKKATSLTPIEEMRTQTGTMRVSTPEATALDLVRYETSLGGLSAVATVLSELVERIDAKRLLDAAKVEVELSVVQRTGYLLDRVGARKKTEALSRWLTTRRPHVVLLRPGKGPRRGKVVTRWAVIPNETIEVDQ